MVPVVGHTFALVTPLMTSEIALSWSGTLLEFVTVISNR